MIGRARENFMFFFVVSVFVFFVRIGAVLEMWGAAHSFPLARVLFYPLQPRKCAVRSTIPFHGYNIMNQTEAPQITVQVA
jgi:hypothetical protein